MNNRFGVWFVAVAMCIATTMAAAVAFRRFPDRSTFALVHWSVIALALVGPLLLIPGLLSTGPLDATQARNRCSRVVILVYLPLLSSLLLLAFNSR